MKKSVFLCLAVLGMVMMTLGSCEKKPLPAPEPDPNPVDTTEVPVDTTTVEANIDTTIVVALIDTTLVSANYDEETSKISFNMQVVAQETTTIKEESKEDVVTAVTDTVDFITTSLFTTTFDNDVKVYSADVFNRDNAVISDIVDGSASFSFSGSEVSGKHVFDATSITETEVTAFGKTFGIAPDISFDKAFYYDYSDVNANNSTKITLNFLQYFSVNGHEPISVPYASYYFLSNVSDEINVLSTTLLSATFDETSELITFNMNAVVEKATTITEEGKEDVIKKFTETIGFSTTADFSLVLDKSVMIFDGDVFYPNNAIISGVSSSAASFAFKDTNVEGYFQFGTETIAEVEITAFGEALKVKPVISCANLAFDGVNIFDTEAELHFFVTFANESDGGSIDHEVIVNYPITPEEPVSVEILGTSVLDFNIRPIWNVDFVSEFEVFLRVEFETNTIFNSGYEYTDTRDYVKSSKVVLSAKDLPEGVHPHDVISIENLVSDGKFDALGKAQTVFTDYVIDKQEIIDTNDAETIAGTTIDPANVVDLTPYFVSSTTLDQYESVIYNINGQEVELKIPH